MRLRFVICILSSFIVLTSGCSQTHMSETSSNSDSYLENTYKVSKDVIRVPYSLLKFSGMTTDEFISTSESIGDEVYGYVDGEYIDIIPNEDVDVTISKNNEFIDELIVDFTDSNSEYYIIGSDDYKSLELGFDEHFDTDLLSKTLLGIIAEYGYNQVLMGIEDWYVDVTVYNCHTGNVVNAGRIPYEEVNVTSELWQDSYK